MNDADSFRSAANILCKDITALLIDNKSVQNRLNDSPDIAFLKSADGRILASNMQHIAEYGNVVGRLATDYVDDVTKRIASLSDDLILSGCSRVDLVYTAYDAAGRPARIRAAKRSLASAKTQFSTLVVLRVEEILAESPSKSGELFTAWQTYKQLSPRHQEVALSAAQGCTMQQVADHLKVSRKTVENYRAELLAKLHVDNTHQLMRLLVRLQDNGYCDLGL